MRPEPWWRWSSDHQSFRNSGVIGLMLTDGNDSDGKDKMYIHTPEDSKDKIDFEYTEKVVDMVLRVLIRLDKK